MKHVWTGFAFLSLFVPSLGVADTPSDTPEVEQKTTQHRTTRQIRRWDRDHQTDYADFRRDKQARRRALGRQTIRTRQRKASDVLQERRSIQQLNERRRARRYRSVDADALKKRHYLRRSRLRSQRSEKTTHGFRQGVSSYKNQRQKWYNLQRRQNSQ